MKTQHYTYLLVTLIICFMFTSTGFAQPGRYKHNRGYYRYYPQRGYGYSRPYVSIHFNSYDYRYNRGYFYRPYGSVLRVVIPPIGIRIGTLPYGYRSFYMGPHPYYYYNGIYYRPHDNEYEVVAPPLGAIVDKLPPGAKAKVIDGQKYYELNGTYYKEEMNDNDELAYKVVGTDGVLNTDKEETVSSEPAIGDQIDELPADSKEVVINGEKLYSTPSGLYYKKVIRQNKVYYELVGK
jgi:hypothetical protein